MEKQLKPFDPVLVRDTNEEIWGIEHFGHKRPDGRFVCTGRCAWEQCIPYEGNEDLISTNYSPHVEDRWRADHAQPYWYVHSTLCPRSTIDTRGTEDDSRYYAGNYFSSKVEAQQMADSMSSFLKTKVDSDISYCTGPAKVALTAPKDR